MSHKWAIACQQENRSIGLFYARNQLLPEGSITLCRLYGDGTLFQPIIFTEEAMAQDMITYLTRRKAAGLFGWKPIKVWVTQTDETESAPTFPRKDIP